MDLNCEYVFGLVGIFLPPVIVILSFVFRIALQRKFWIVLSIGIALLLFEFYFINRVVQHESSLAKQREEQRLVNEQKEKESFEKNRVLLSEVPGEVVKPCLDKNGQIADRDEPWEYSDAISDPKLPRSRMVLACKYADGTWYIQCEKGGFSLQRLQYRFTKNSNDQWQSTQLGGDLKEYCPDEKE